jgi:predicted RND superfamily exporter protein
LNNWKDKVEIKLEIFSDFIFNNKFKILILILLTTVALTTQIKNITFDTSTEGFLKEDDKYRIAYNEFRDQFGREEKVLIIIKTDNIFDLEFIKTLNKLHKELENNLPYLKEVNSLINARNTIGNEESLLVDDLFDKIPTNKLDMDIKKELAHKNPLLDNLLINDAGDITAIIIDSVTYSNANIKPINEEDEFDDEFDESDTKKKDVKLEYLSSIENEAISRKAQEIVAKYESDNFKTYVSGSIVINDTIKSSMKNDIAFFIRVLIITIIVLLLVLFRRASAVIFPMIATALAIVATISAMAIFDVPITIVTQILPSFLLSVTIGASVHFMSIFYKKYDLTKDKKASLRYTMGHSGLAIIMTSLTTAMGIFSFSFSEVAPIANLGLFSAVGIMLGLVYSLVLLPVLLSIFNIKAKEVKMQDNKVKENLMDKILLSIAHISVTYPKIIITISAIIIFTALFIASSIKYSHNPMNWLAPDMKVKIATDLVDKDFKGASTIEIIIDTKKENGLYDPKILKAIESFSNDLLTIKSDKYYIGKTLSIVDILKETNKALHGNDKKFYSIPEDKNLIAQELFLFSNSGSDDMEKFVDSKFSKARLTVKMPFIDAIDYMVLQKEVNEKIKLHFDDDITVNATGVSDMLSRVMSAAIHSSAFSYLLAYASITLIMIILLGSIKMGLISMIPNIAPILFMTMVMVMFDMKLDLFTMLIGSIAIGLAVDDTVHFMHGFNKYYAKYKDVNRAVRETLLSTGRAIFVTTIILTVGFMVFIGSSMNNLFNFGILTAIAINMALVADFFLMPAILKIMKKKENNEKNNIN